MRQIAHRQTRTASALSALTHYVWAWRTWPTNTWRPNRAFHRLVTTAWKCSIAILHSILHLLPPGTPPVNRTRDAPRVTC